MKLIFLYLYALITTDTKRAREKYHQGYLCNYLKSLVYTLLNFSLATGSNKVARLQTIHFL